MGELLPLAAVQEAVLEFLQGREDAAVYGAQAVNAYVDQPRMTQDVDLLSTRAGALAEQLRKYLSARFAIAVRVHLRRLLLAFPELKNEEGAVHSALQAMSAPKEAFAAWRELVAEELLPDDEDAGF